MNADIPFKHADGAARKLSNENNAIQAIWLVSRQLSTNNPIKKNMNHWCVKLFTADSLVSVDLFVKMEVEISECMLKV